MFAPYWGKELPTDLLDLEDGPTVGGGEEAGIRTAVEAAALGHEVVCYGPLKSGRWRGVEFRGPEASFYPEVVAGGWDVIVSWSSVRPLELAGPGTRRIFAQQLNDLAGAGLWDRVDCVISPSRDHAEQVWHSWGWRGKRAVVHNGLMPELYADAPAWHDRPLDVGYWSSPDRGLHHLLRAWPSVRERVPGARLHVFYEIKRYLEMIEPLPLFFIGARGIEVRDLMRSAAQDKSIIFHGAVTRRRLADFQRNCRVMCYPFDPVCYTEGFCGAVNQGIGAGCTVLTRPKDALPSLFEGRVHWLGWAGADARQFVQEVADQTVRALRGELPDQERRRTAPRRPFTWQAAGREFVDACAGVGWF